MMKRPPQTTSLDLNLAPMVDVIMCLLIFFMLATNLVQNENSAIDLPIAAAARDAEKQALGNRVVVNVRPVGDVDAGEAVFEMNGEPVTVDQVYARLRIEGEADPNVNCVIRAGRGVPYRYVEAIFVGCARAKVGNITFSALRGAAGEG